ncbi:MAG: hypothetical protein IPP17_07645 [Bacteroidetes bacterium]|nr:hypothetical protein [Bacteroidota bacterium]
MKASTMKANQSPMRDVIQREKPLCGSREEFRVNRTARMAKNRMKYRLAGAGLPSMRSTTESKQCLYFPEHPQFSA